ncbi:hypothetical protein D3C86_1960490 [compost metagenome]
MIKGAKTIQRQGLTDSVGMIGSHHADITFIEQLRRVKTRRSAVRRHQRPVDIPTIQLTE